MEEEGVGARREGAAGVVVDGRVGAAGREGEAEAERERENGETLAGAAPPRLPHREGTSGRRRRRRRVQMVLWYREFGRRWKVGGGSGLAGSGC